VRSGFAAEKFAAHQEKVVERPLVPADLLRAVLPQLTVTDAFENLTLQSCLPKDFVLLVAKLPQLRQCLPDPFGGWRARSCTTDRTAILRR